MLRIPVDRIRAGESLLEGQAGHHLGRVLRVRPGERVILFDPERGEQAHAEVLECGKRGVLCRVDTIERATLATPPATTLIQAIGKGDKVDAVVRDATELGVTRIVAVETARSVVHLDAERGAARAERWRRIVREAARQCGRFDVPLIEGPCAWAEALHIATELGGTRLCMWEQAVDPIGPRIAACGASHVAIAVGPEGGLAPEEAALAEREGFMVASLGPLILRTETVAAAVLGAILVQRQLTDASTPSATRTTATAPIPT